MKAKYDLVLHSLSDRNRTVMVTVTPELAWGIMYAFVMLELWLSKYVGMRAHVLRPGSNDKLRWHVDEIEDHHIRVCLDLPPCPDGQRTTLVCMRSEGQLDLFAIRFSANGKSAWASVSASPEKMLSIMNMAAYFGPVERYTLEKYCKVAPSSVEPSPVPYRMADSHWRNPLPRLELSEEFEPFVSVRSMLLATGQQSKLGQPAEMRALVRAESQGQLAEA